MIIFNKQRPSFHPIFSSFDFRNSHEFKQKRLCDEISVRFVCKSENTFRCFLCKPEPSDAYKEKFRELYLWYSMWFCWYVYMWNSYIFKVRKNEHQFNIYRLYIDRSRLARNVVLSLDTTYQWKLMEVDNKDRTLKESAYILPISIETNNLVKYSFEQTHSDNIRFKIKSAKAFDTGQFWYLSNTNNSQYSPEILRQRAIDLKTDSD